MTTELQITSLEQNFNSAIMSKKSSLDLTAHEKELNRLNTVFFPLHHDMSKTRIAVENSQYILVRETTHDNGVISFAFGSEIWSYGKRLTSKELIAQGFGYTDSFTGKTRAHVNPLSGYRVSYKVTSSGTVLYRVNAKGEAIPFKSVDTNVLRLADKIVRESLKFRELATKNGLKYPDFRSFTGNLDRHMPHNNASVVITKDIPVLSVESLPDYAILSDEEFMAEFAAS